MNTVVVISTGDLPAPATLAAIPTGAVVIAADRGVDYALHAGLPIEAAVGDFDSISEEGLRALERSGVRIERHPADKDASDLELALDAALELAPRRLLVLGGGHDRLDHLLAELLLLASDRYADVEVDAIFGASSVHVVRGSRTLLGAPGGLISLLALHGPATGVVTDGLRYPLTGETLAPGSTRGLSNVFAADEARVSVEGGVLLAVQAL